MEFLKRLVVSALAVLVTAAIMPGVHVNGALTAVIVAAVLAFLNAIVKPILILLTIPITLFTFGLFLLVINAGMILLTANLVDNFTIDPPRFWIALFFSLILSLVNAVFESIARKKTE